MLDLTNRNLITNAEESIEKKTMTAIDLSSSSSQQQHQQQQQQQLISDNTLDYNLSSFDTAITNEEDINNNNIATAAACNYYNEQNYDNLNNAAAAATVQENGFDNFFENILYSVIGEDKEFFHLTNSVIKKIFNAIEIKIFKKDEIIQNLLLQNEFLTKEKNEQICEKNIVIEELKEIIKLLKSIKNCKIYKMKSSTNNDAAAATTTSTNAAAAAAADLSKNVTQKSSMSLKTVPLC